MTLLEVLLYIALATVLLYVGTSLYFLSVTTHAKVHAVLEVEHNATWVLLRVRQTIHDANEVVTPSVGESGGTLVLTMLDESRSPTTITLVEGRLMFGEGASPPVPLSAEGVVVASLLFHNLSVGTTTESVETQLQMSYKNEGGRNELQFSDTYYATANTRP